ncbi:alanine--tRNA ligase [Boudabousia marimammalium]|uniref:Alanine--tRNA ligase n=1 Tax=Boudabousia marimammalium TaxID=156892 RepID=A0A1Q5PRA6_9ACTO|nr:alanine--tRNA ligase [Boudabousia marimammalium]OKL50012.1 alanine--tRNA ligase [Boudabousia marimammalium]
MRTSEIRQRWLDFFESKEHHIAPSVPLISPDPSILFTIAGMVPFIPYIVGTEAAPWPRVASVQKCIRTNDIDNVGKTTRHGTFFQMNGNFSFGDYFKEGAIDFAWELLTSPTDKGGYGLDGDRFWITLWEEDHESFDTLTKHIGIDPRQIVKLPRQENFWDTGQPGPAGPCAEWHYDRGPEYGPEAVGGTVDPGGDRYLEVWNLVFDQFMRGEGSGKDYPLLGELDKKCIDTGAGLERLAVLLQGKNNMYEIDEVFPVISRTEQLTGLTYGKNDDPLVDIRMRVIADHLRSSLMLISDGVIPGNDGRGYVLRRLVRRAVRSMRLLGVDTAVLPELLPVSKEVMARSYPELNDRWDAIQATAYAEEESFLRTLTAGTTILDTRVQEAKSRANNGKGVLSGADAFALHDTYGFPIDLTLEMAAEQGVSVDEEAFRSLMQEQKDRARKDAVAKKTGHVDSRVYHDLQNAVGGEVQFLGYTESKANGTVMGMLQNGQPATVVSGPAEFDLVLDQTPFWAEMGGQLADQGTITTAHGVVAEVKDVQAPVKGLIVHRAFVPAGEIALGDQVETQIDVIRRRDIARAHTSTHMVHKALHEFVGEQATQAGSENSPSRMRFDFRHGKQLSPDVLNSIEQRCNERLAENLEVFDQVMDIDQARAMGAMALFGEKYGKRVRVVTIGDGWSRELCAGTHTSTTGSIGRITLLGESSIGSGVRRLDALVGEGAYAHQAKEHALVSQLTSLMGRKADELPDAIETMMSRMKAAEKELAQLQTERTVAKAGELAKSVSEVNGIRLVNAHLGEISGGDALRTAAQRIREQLDDDRPLVVSLSAEMSAKGMLIVATNGAARKQDLMAGNLVKEAAKQAGGGGGGKPDMAQAGIKDASALSIAREAVSAALRQH